MENPRDWIHGDETAQDFVSRVLSERPSLLLPPLHRAPLRVGNVVEIVGPSPSAKSEILLQAAINCILPKEWKGVHFGGLERMVMYFDLDCRFDALRLSNTLKLRIMEAFALVHFNGLIEHASHYVIVTIKGKLSLFKFGQKLLFKKSVTFYKCNHCWY